MMLRHLLLPILLLGLIGGGDLGAAEDGIRLLEDAVAIGSELPKRQRGWHGKIEVPAGATSLAVLVSADRDVDLYLRRGKPAERDYAETADAAAFSPSRHEVIVVTSRTAPRLQAGTWYVTVENPFPCSGRVAFELVVFVDRRGGEQTLLPGMQLPLVLTSPARSARFRTYLPARASRAVVELMPPPPGGIRFQIDGPKAFQRRGDSRPGRLVLEGVEAPAGTHLVAIAPRRASSRALRTAARMTIDFPNGEALPVPPSPTLAPDTPLPFVLGGARQRDVQRLQIHIPEGVKGFVLEAANAGGRDVDLHVRRDAPPRHEDEDAEWLAMSTAPVERLVVGGQKSLKAGVYHAEVVLLDAASPVEVVVTLRRIAGDDGPYSWGKPDLPVLMPDTWTRGAVRVAESGITWYALDAPVGTGSLHAQVLDATGPLELVLARTDDGSIDARAFSAQVDEYLGVELRPPLQRATQFRLGVLNRATWDDEVTYRIAVGLDRRPRLPDDLEWPATLDPEALSPVERTAAATVEITIGDCSGGSGVCLTPGGLVLSCRHCLELTDGTGRVQRDRILVAFPRTLDLPPVQAFYAKIVGEDVERDLVLLEPLKDVFGRPVTSDIRFPFIPLGESGSVRLGEELYVAGYPQVGSECIRTAVVISHGIVAGLERQAAGPAWIKTDAWVAPGHSGGPVVDGQGRLVGLAAATLGKTESLGLCVPVERFPPAWVARIRKGAAPEGE